MANKQSLLLTAKWLGGKEVESEAHRSKKAVKGFGEEVEKTDKKLSDTRGFTHYEESQKKARKATEHHHEILKKSKGMIENVLGAVGITAGAAGVTTLIKAGAAAESQETSLQGALRRTGQTHAGVMNEINQRVARSAVSGGFTTNEQLQGITQFVGVTKNLTKAMQLNQAATDLARGTHIGFSRAQKMVQQGLSGSVGQLQRFLGPIVATHTHMEALTNSIAAQTLAAHRQDQVWKLQHPHAILLAEAMKKATPAQKEHAKLLDKQAESTKVLSLIQGRFAGEEASYNRTRAAQLSNMHNSLDITEAKLGKALLPLFLKLTKAFSVFVTTMIKDWPKIWAVAGPPIKAVGGAIIAFAKWVGHSTTMLKVLGGLLVVGAGAWLGYKVVVGAANAVEKINNDITLVKETWQKRQVIWTAATTAATQGYTVAQWLANAALAAFPVIAIIAGLIALGVGIYELIKHWHAVWNVVKGFAKWIWDHATFLIPFLGPAIFVVKTIIEHWGGLVKFFEGLPKKLASIGKAIGEGLFSGVKWAINELAIAPINALLHGAHMLYRKIPDPLGMLPSWPFGDPAIPKLAAGGRIMQGGMALIGERGPEILGLPTGARVEPLRNQGGAPGLSSMFQAVGGDLHVHLEVENKELASAVLKDFRKKNARI